MSKVALAAGQLELEISDEDFARLEKVERAISDIESIATVASSIATTGDPINEFEAIELAEVARRTFSSLERPDATLRIEDWPTIMADRACLTRILENLFQNAIDHAEPGVTIEIGRSADGFYIMDDGPGIPEEIGSQVFEAGYSTAPDHDGIGLTIVNQVVAAHGWEILIDPHTTDGTRFEIQSVTFGESRG